MRILFLEAELMGYQIAVIKELISKYQAEVYVMHWDHKKLTSYIPPEVHGLKYFKRSDFDLSTMNHTMIQLNPDIVYVCGWMDRAYLRLGRQLRKIGVPVVAASDTQWKGNLKQKIASLIFPYTIKKCFSHIWVAGPYQYEYARKLGFAKEEIIFNCLSADVDLFNKAYIESSALKASKYPHRFLFVGRFEKVKGIDLLIKAWEGLEGDIKDWELCFIGDGTLFENLSSSSNITVRKFLQPEELIKNVHNYGCLILPSRVEPWAVVLHEFSAAGLPIICSDSCGAAPVFIIPNFNGFTFRSEDAADLMNKMRRIINKNDSELMAMSRKSHSLGQKITPKIAAANLLSVLN